MEERRKVPRRRVLKTGRIIFNNDRAVISCTVRNLSPAGALLLFPSALGIPPHFELQMDGETSRTACDVIWRHDQRLGVRFSPRATNAA